jgi:hypothetical protein
MAFWAGNAGSPASLGRVHARGQVVPDDGDARPSTCVGAGREIAEVTCAVDIGGRFPDGRADTAR